jgi:uncharacterized small protein (DUF1192 family)
MPQRADAYPEGVEDDMDLSTVTESMEGTLGEIERLQAKLKDKTDWIIRLYKRHRVIQDAFFGGFRMAEFPGKEDGRKKFNPVRNLKISAVRAYGWAKDDGKDAAEAYDSAREATLDAARKRYADQPGVCEYLRRNQLPPTVEDYLVNWRDHYSEVKS